MVKDETEEMPKEVQAQNGLENSEKGDQRANADFWSKILFSLCEDMEKKVLGGLFQINPVTKTGQRLYMVRRPL